MGTYPNTDFEVKELKEVLNTRKESQSIDIEWYAIIDSWTWSILYGYIILTNDWYKQQAVAEIC